MMAAKNSIHTTKVYYTWEKVNRRTEAFISGSDLLIFESLDKIEDNWGNG